VSEADRVAVVYDDPMAKVLGLDAKTSGVGAWFGFGSGGTLAAAAIMALASFVAWLHTSKARVADVTQDVDLVNEAPPPPPPPPPEPEPEPEAKPAPRAVREPAQQEAPPPPAQASKVLSQEPDRKEPVDLTGNVFVQGNGDAYVGGPTSGTGTGTLADRAGYGPPATRGAGPLLAAPPPPPILAADLSRDASIGHWSCSDFPEEADSAGIDEAYVMIQVDVNASGTVTAVRVLQDPGSGFGAQARRCAMRQHFQPALDREGNPMPGSTKPFRVHFSR